MYAQIICSRKLFSFYKVVRAYCRSSDFVEMSRRRRNIIIASAAFLLLHEAETMKKKPKRWWITKLYESRQAYSGCNLLTVMRVQENNGNFKNFCRMSSEDFELLIIAIGPKISKIDTRFRRSISVQERLAVTLRFLATGDSYTSLQYLFKISKQLISAIVPEVCKALIEVLKEHVHVSMKTYLFISKRIVNI